LILVLISRNVEEWSDSAVISKSTNVERNHATQVTSLRL